MDDLIDTFGKVFEGLIQILYESDKQSTIETLKEMSLDAGVLVYDKFFFILIISSAVISGIVVACILGCFMCCCACCCCPVYDDDFQSNYETNNANPSTNQRDIQYNYYG